MLIHEAVSPNRRPAIYEHPTKGFSLDQQTFTTSDSQQNFNFSCNEISVDFCGETDALQSTSATTIIPTGNFPTVEFSLFTRFVPILPGPNFIANLYFYLQTLSLEPYEGEFE